jgi:parallel beta-helix repeat protein
MKKILLFACGLLGSFGGNACFAENQVEKPAVQATAAGSRFRNPFAIDSTRSLCAPKNTMRSAAAAAMSGNYTINKNGGASATNFISFGAAVQALQTNGVGGPVIFTVVANSGPYTEQVVLPVISGVSAANTVTFEGSNNTVSAAGGTNPGVFSFIGADFVKLNNLQINLDVAATTGSGISFISASDNNTVSNCTINASAASVSMSVYGIMAGTTGGNNANNLLLQNNIVIGGNYGILLTGAANTTGNRIMNNQVRDARSTGIYVHNAGSGTIIEGNDISRPTRINTQGFYGFYLTGTSSNTIVSKNRVHNTHDQASNKLSFSYGFYSYTVASPGNENIFKNNLVYNVTNNGGPMYGFYNVDANDTYYYNNTVSADNPAISYTTLRGFYLQYNSTNIKFINNIISLTSPATNKHAIYLGGTTPSLISNNNDLYVGTNGGHIGYHMGNNTTFADWKTANGGFYDQNSVSVDPLFINAITGQLLPTASSVLNIGQPLAAVTDDILGNPRSTTTPDPGAFEFTQPANDAGITAIVAPVSPVNPGSQPVTVTLKNFGSANLTSATIGWKVNGVAQPDFTWAGSLATMQATSSPVPIGIFNFTAGNHNICAWAKNPNGSPDGLAINDSTCTTLNACAALTGNYTINKNNPTAGTNFQSISAAAARLSTCGVSGPVTLTVASGTGPYNEQVEILEIPYTSATNTVTFEGSGNTVSATPGARFGIFVLNGADYVKLNNFVITLPATATAGWGVQLINAADHNTISNNTINLPIIASTFNIHGITSGTAIEAKGNNASYTKIQNNIINGGGCGIQLNGDNGGINAVNNEITGNQVKDAYSYGIYAGNGDGSLIEGNDISRPTRTTSSTFYGLYLFGENKNSIISKNRIHNTHDMFTTTGSVVYGIYNNALNNAGNNTFKNNLIYNLNPPAGEAMGIYSGGTGNFFYHNTITSDPAFSYFSLRGIYLTNSAANVQIKNNLISLPSATANKYAIYLSGSGTTNVSNYNNLYVGNTGNIGNFNSADYSTLANWQAVPGNAYDQNSVSLNPLFVNAATGNYTPTSVGINNISQALPAVTEDILGTARNPVTPDPGAYEFEVAANDVGIIAVTGPTATGCGLTAAENITVTIKNYGSATQTAIPVTYSVNGVAIAASETFSGSLAPFATATYTFTTKANLTTAATSQIIARTVLTGDLITNNDPDTLSIVNYLLTGMPLAFNFETPATGITKFRKVVNPKSKITEAAGASIGTGSTKGMILDGIDNAGWIVPTGSTNPWTINPNNFAGAYICFSPGNGAATDSLILTFDLKQLFKTANVNTNFRVTVNGMQVGPTYRPPFSGTPIVWQKIKINLTSYLIQSAIQIGLESSVKETFANGTGTANLIDNIEVKRVSGPTGMKSDLLADQLHVFPNPGKGIFNVNLPAGKGYQLVVTDMAGKVLKTQTAGAGTNQVNLEGLAKGIYLLHVSNAGASAVKKMIIE